MALHGWLHRVPATLTACLMAAVVCPGLARADVISATATLPLLGVPYESAAGAGCFATVNVCVSNGTFTLTSVVSSTFNMSGDQVIVADASYQAILTDSSNTPLGSFTLTGTMKQEVVGRTFSTETGSWPVDIVSMSLSGLLAGPLSGNTLTLSQDGANASTGTTSIVPLGDQGYSISSFFDVFADLSLDTNPPREKVVGPIRLTATPAPTSAPEPAGLLILALPAAWLAWSARSSRRPIAAG